MTIPSTTRKAGPLLGTGVQTAWPFAFKVFTGADVLVAIADSIGAETTLVLDTDYSVTLNANQDTSPGGTVTYPLSGAPLAVGSTITVVGDIDYDQPLDLPAGGNFSPTAIENELDRLMMQIQQLREVTTRAFLSPVSSSASGQLPAPAANTLIGWDTTGTNLQNVPLSSISTSATYGAMTDDPFTGDGVTTSFLLTHDPIVLANMTVVVDGFTLKAGTAFTLSAGRAVFAVAPSLGAKIVVRYGQVLDVGTLLSTGIGDATVTGRSLLTAANAAAARTTIGAQAALGFTPAASGANTDITSLGALTTIQSVPVRQTVLGGPVDTNGFPSFLPATSVNLNLTTQNVSTGVNALVATAAGGANAGGAINAVGQAVSNLTWTGCTANQINFLPVSIAAGVLTALTPVILPPIYQFGGTPAVTAGQYTYNIQQGIMWLGNGATATAVNHVIAGECAAGASTITSTTAYAYQGRCIGSYGSAAAATATAFTHNLGVYPGRQRTVLLCVTAEFGASVGDEVDNFSANSGGLGETDGMSVFCHKYTLRVQTGYRFAINSYGAAQTANYYPTAANWKLKSYVDRGW